jgi:hypothetical protein
MTLGTEWLIDASGCDAAALADLDRMRAVFERVIRDLDLNVLGEIAYDGTSSIIPAASAVSRCSPNRISPATRIRNSRRRRSTCTAVATALRGRGKQR